MKIVVDAMGGDNAPAAIVEGVVQALRDHDVQIVLVGDQEAIRRELRGHSFPASRVDIVHAPEAIGMDEPAVTGLRKKKNSSISIGMGLLKDPEYKAFLSAGNTGAVVAVATVNLGLIEGVERPAIGLVFPTLRGFSFLIDVGANIDPKPIHMLQSALMATVYMRDVMGVPNPSVGLLNIGEEATKGSGFVKEIHKMMREALPNFVGNIEATEILNGRSDCIICDGYVGNVVIKLSQGLMESLSQLFKREIKKSPVSILGAGILKGALSRIRSIADYTEYGGAPLLGVNGNVMICHGRSSPKAIKNAIRATCREIEYNVMQGIAREIVRGREALASPAPTPTPEG